MRKLSLNLPAKLLRSAQISRLLPAISVRLNGTSFQPIQGGQLNDISAADKVFRLSCLSHSCEMVSPFIRSNEILIS